MSLNLAPGRAGRRALNTPARLVTLAFGAAIVVGTILLLLPVAAEDGEASSFAVASFTATSAVTVTGLALVDTAGHWSRFGEVVILLLIQLGGIGIMTLASLVMLGLSRRLGLRHRLVAQAEIGLQSLGELRRVLRAVVVISAATEAVVAVVLVARFWTAYDTSLPRALWLGVFHAVSSFNNAGFALFSDSLMRFATDPVITLTVAVAIVIGSLGVPVLAELRTDGFHVRRWTLHTKLVVLTTAALIAAGWILIGAFEWSNAETLGGLPDDDKVLGALFHSITPRSAGFSTVDYAEMNETTWLVTTALMFIGGAPVSTGGGIKVTTFALLAFVIWSEVRGDRDVNLFGRRIPTAAHRQALSIALVSIGVVAVCTLWLMALGDWGLSAVLFEVVSAFSTGGLSTGITPEIPVVGRVLLALLMFAGRVGPLTVSAALAVRQRDQRIRYPEERPFIG